MTLYVIAFDESGFCKIGQTQDWEQRLRTHRRGARFVRVHYLNHDAGLREERALKRLLKGLNKPWPGSQREMFLLNEHILALIRELKAPEDFQLALMEGDWGRPPSPEVDGRKGRM
jgi:hypothetical protein